MSLFEKLKVDYGYKAKEPTPVRISQPMSQEDEEEKERKRLERVAKALKAQADYDKKQREIKMLQARDKAKREELTLNKNAINGLAEEKYPNIGSIKTKPFETPVTDRYKGTTQGFEKGKEVKKPPRIGDVLDRYNNRFDVTRYQNNAKELQNDLSIATSQYSGMNPNKKTNTVDVIDWIFMKDKDGDIDKTLNKIEGELKAGKESTVQNVQEGWWKREVENLLSKETLKEIDDKPNEAQKIRDWLEAHPDIEDYQADEPWVSGNSYTGLFKQETESFKESGLRGIGDISRLGFDSYKSAVQDPEALGITVAFGVASILAAPATGGLSLGLLPLSSSAPLLASRLPTALKMAKSLEGLGAITMGMKYGAMKNMATIEMVSSYENQVAMGVDPKVAKIIAPIVGVANGIIEQSQFELAFKGIPALTKMVTESKKLGMKLGTTELMKMAKGYGINLSKEVAEEVMQEAITYAGTSAGIAEMEKHKMLNDMLEVINLL